MTEIFLVILFQSHKTEVYRNHYTVCMLNGMFSEMFAGWFQNTGSNYNAFIKSMLHGNIRHYGFAFEGKKVLIGN